MGFNEHGGLIKTIREFSIPLTTVNHLNHRLPVGSRKRILRFSCFKNNSKNERSKKMPKFCYFLIGERIVGLVSAG